MIGLLITLVLGLTSVLVVRRERRAEAGRLAAEERSRRLAETSTDLLIVHDRRGRIAYASPACRELLGVEPGTMLGRRPQELIHPEDLPQAAAAISQVAAGLDKLTATLRLRRADGTWVWVETRVRVLRDADGNAVEAHSTVRDITERMEAEARFRSTFEHAPMAWRSPGWTAASSASTTRSRRSWATRAISSRAATSSPSRTRPTARRTAPACNACSTARATRTGRRSATSTPTGTPYGWRCPRR